MARGVGLERLDGWKAIAAFFGRDERTVKRWERARGLPIHRIPGGGRAAVWADSAELRRWLGGEPEAQAAGPALPSRPDRRWIVAATGAVALGVLGGAVGYVWQDRSAHHPTGAEAYADDPATQALYMRAVLAWESRTPNGLADAVRDLDEVIRRRPDRAEGHAKLADCYLLLREFGVMPEAEAYDRAEAAARRALTIDPGSPSALRALAFTRFWGRADPTALRLFEQALERDQQSAQTHHWYANALMARGRYREALEQIRKARTLQPADVSLSASEAQARAAAGEVEAARRELARLLAVYPQSIAAHRAAAWVAMRGGDAGGFLRESEIEAALRRDSARLEALRAVRAAFEAGGAPAMFAALARAEAAARPSGRGNAVMTAYYWTLAGDPDAARQWLATAQAAREPDLIFIPQLPQLAALSR